MLHVISSVTLFQSADQKGGTAMKKIKGVGLDYGNVVGKVDKRRPCAELATRSGFSVNEVFRLLVDSAQEQAFESGGMTDQEFCEWAIESLRIDISVQEFKDIWGDAFEECPQTLPVIEKLVALHVPVAILSNTNSIHWPWMRDLPAMRALLAVDAPMLLSHEIRAFKPDSRMYQALVDALGLPPGEILYLDDLKANVQGASSFGLVAELYDCRNASPTLEEIMRRRGLLP